MRELGLHCPVRRRKRYNSFRGEVGEAADNLLNRQFTTRFRHPKWATDVTEFYVGISKVYLSPIIDLRDNRIISATAEPSPCTHPNDCSKSRPNSTPDPGKRAAESLLPKPWTGYCLNQENSPLQRPPEFADP